MNAKNLERVIPPHPDKFFVYDTDLHKFVAVEGKAITVPGMEQFDIFIHPTYLNASMWSATEGKTGGKLYSCYMQDEQFIALEIKRLAGTLKKRGVPSLDRQIEAQLPLTGLSPRWTP